VGARGAERFAFWGLLLDPWGMPRRAPAAALLAGSLLLTSTGAHAQPPPDPDPWWGTDKALHFGLSAAITGGGYGVAAPFTDDIAGRAAIAASVGIGVGLAKEVADALGLGTPSWRDFVWDVIGTGVGLSVSVSIDLGVRAARGK
jgi:putative lipoprotein